MMKLQNYIDQDKVTTKPFLARSEDEARELFGTDYQLVEVIDPAKRLTVDAGKGVKKEVIDKNNRCYGCN